MAEGGFDLVLLQEKGAGHALNIAGGEAAEVAIHPGEQHAGDAFAVEILAELGAAQAEGLVEFALRIGEARQVVEMVGGKEFCGALLGAEMNKSDARAFLFDWRAKFAELGDRLAAEGSTKMTEEDEQQGALRGERSDGFALLGEIGLEQCRINALCGEHCGFIFTDFRARGNAG